MKYKDRDPTEHRRQNVREDRPPSALVVAVHHLVTKAILLKLLRYSNEKHIRWQEYKRGTMNTSFY